MNITLQMFFFLNDEIRCIIISCNLYSWLANESTLLQQGLIRDFSVRIRKEPEMTGSDFFYLWNRRWSDPTFSICGAGDDRIRLFLTVESEISGSDFFYLWSRRWLDPTFSICGAGDDRIRLFLSVEPEMISVKWLFEMFIWNQSNDNFSDL